MNQRYIAADPILDREFWRKHKRSSKHSFIDNSFSETGWDLTHTEKVERLCPYLKQSPSNWPASTKNDKAFS